MPEPTDSTIEKLTISELFALPADGTATLSAGLDPKDFETIEKKLSGLRKPIPWSRVQTEVAGQISSTLNTGVLDVWASAWKKYKDVQQDVAESRKSPEAIVLSRLAEHSLNSTLHPYVEVFLGPVKLEKIVFDVCLTTHMSGLILGLTNGSLVSFQVAQCDWTGSIVTKGVTLLKRKLKTLDLPGRIALKHAIPLSSA